MASATNSTLSAILARYEWLFFEKGMMHVWSELKRMANTDGQGDGALAVLTSFGAVKTVDHRDPDVVEKVHLTLPNGFADQPGNETRGRPPTQAQG